VEDSVHPTNLAVYNDAHENGSLTVGLGPTRIAVPTFVVIFLYDRVASDQIHVLSFRGTLLIIVVSLGLSSLSSPNYWFVREALRSRPLRARTYQMREDGIFASGLVLLVLEPALIVIPVKSCILGDVALAFGVAVIACSRSAGRNSGGESATLAAGCIAPDPVPESRPFRAP
jgi:hypothetical protein